MSAERSVPILRTKLYRPPAAPGVVRRGRLFARLDAGRPLPLNLVSAPAGYGKSTLVSHWLEGRNEPSAWLSLDGADSDLRVFLEYLVAAVRSITPQACAKTLAYLDADALPEARELAGHLINELDAIETPFVLALDDYWRIREPAVHELVSRVLEHPPRPLHLVLISRRDPPLPLTLLRSRGRISEIRLADLEFTTAETAELLQGVGRAPVAVAVLERLRERTEGWVVALKLLGLSLEPESAESVSRLPTNATKRETPMKTKPPQTLPDALEAPCGGGARDMTHSRPSGVPSMSGPAWYRIRVQGSLGPEWVERLGGMTSTSAPGAGGREETVFEGLLQDQAALCGILNTLYELHLPVLKVERLEEEPVDS